MFIKFTILTTALKKFINASYGSFRPKFRGSFKVNFSRDCDFGAVFRLFLTVIVIEGSFYIIFSDLGAVFKLILVIFGRFLGYFQPRSWFKGIFIDFMLLF